MSNALLGQTLASLRAHRVAAQSRGVDLIGVTGSVARGDSGPESDIDIVYGVVGRASLFDVGSVLMDLQDDLGRQVDMVDLACVKPRLRQLMERDLVRA